jgi:hypothetical protein
MPITRISGERANNTNKIYPEKTRQPTVTDDLPRLLAILPDDLTADGSAPMAAIGAASTSSNQTTLQAIPSPRPTCGDRVRSGSRPYRSLAVG